MAELVRFYGGDPMQWLNVTPLAVVRACLDQLPRLRAKESLRQRAAMMSAVGTISQQEGRRLLQDWLRAADADAAAPRPAAPSREHLGDMGIGVRLVRKVTDGDR